MADSCVADVFKVEQTSNPITVHLVIKKLPTEAQPSSQSHVETPAPAISSSQQHQEAGHIHGTIATEGEASYFKAIFDKKKGADNKVEFKQMLGFLYSYWKWLGQHNLRGLLSLMMLYIVY